MPGINVKFYPIDSKYFIYLCCYNICSTILRLLRDENGAKTVLLKLPKGFYMAPHSHITSEQNFVLEGEYFSNGKSFPAGSYQIFSHGDEHGPFESKKGALILVVWDPLQVSQ